MLKIFLSVVCIILFFAVPCFGMTSYYVDASRTSNGDGSEADPWKAWSDINWSTISTSLGSDDVTIYLSSRDTWSSASNFAVGSSGSSSYTLYILGDEKYNLTDSGTASWQTEDTPYSRVTDTGNLAEFSGGGTFRVFQSYVEVNGVYVNQSTWECFSFGSSNPTNNIRDITLDNCKCYYPSNNHGVWFGYAESGCLNIVVKNSYISNTELEGIYMGHYNYLSDTITGVVIEYNTIVDCGLTGEGDIDIKPGCYGAIVRYNTHYRTIGQNNGRVSGVVISSDATQVYGNEFYNLDEGSNDWGFGIYIHADGDGSTGKTITSCLVYNNLIYGNDRSGIKVGATKSGHPISGLKILNNTITGNTRYGLQLQAASTTITVAEFKNNIVYSNTLYEMYVTSGITFTDCDYNLYYRGQGNSWYYQGAEKTWAQWQALGFDANGVNSDPSLDGNYEADSPSDPSVDQGADLSGTFTIDKDGVTRPVGSAWDIGAYEYGDYTTPTFSSAAVNGVAWSVTFTESVTDAGLDGGEFDFDSDGAAGANNALTYVSGSGTANWTFTGAEVTNGETINLDFDGDTDEVEDDAGNDLADFSDESVTNNTPAQGGTKAPVNTTYLDSSNASTITMDSSNSAITIRGIFE